MFPVAPFIPLGYAAIAPDASPESDPPMSILDPPPRLADLWEAAALLSRLPVPDHNPRGGGAAWAWPLVGAGVAALAAGSGSLGIALGFGPGVVAGIILVVQSLATGGLHEDGLADSADGLWGGRTRARRLEIMKDSRIGSYGVLALLLITLIRWSALTGLVAAGAHWPALIAAGALSRAPMAALMWAMPNARQGGLSHSVGRPGIATVGIGAALALGIALAAGGAAIALGMVLAMALPVAALALLARARIGGQTGDILGATQQLAEAAALSAAGARP